MNTKTHREKDMRNSTFIIALVLSGLIAAMILAMFHFTFKGVM